MHRPALARRDYWAAKSAGLAARSGPAGRLWRLILVAFPSGAVVLSALTFAGYAMGLVRDRMFAHTYGAGPELDAYNAAFVLPELAFNVLVAGAIVAPFVPIFIGLRGEAEEQARTFARTVLTLAIVVMGVSAALLFVFAPQTTAFIAPGFRGEQREWYIGLFRVMCITPVIFAVSFVLGEILVAERRFFTYGLAPLMYNGGIVAGTMLFGGEDQLGIYGAAIGAVIGAVLHLGIRVIGIWRSGFHARPALVTVRSLRQVKGLGEFGRLLLPQMISHPIEQITFLYFTSLASTLGAGAVSSISFARNFQSVPVSFVGASFAIAAFPALSGATASGDRRGFGRIFATNMATILVLTSAAAVTLFVLGGFVIRLFLGSGAFDDEDIARTTMLLSVFTLSIPLESLTHLLTRGLYATHNTVLPTAASVVGFSATVLSASWFAPSIGVAAVPLSFTIGMAVKVALLAVMLAPRIARIGSPRPVPPERPLEMRPARRTLRPAQAFGGLAIAALLVGSVYVGRDALANATLAAQPQVTPWARDRALVALPTPHLVVTPLATVTGTPAPLASEVVSGATASAAPSTATSPTPPPSLGPFEMDLYQKGDFVGEKTDKWCVPAAMQTSINIMTEGADTSKETQQKLWDLATFIAPGKRGGADPEGWAEGLTQLGYGTFVVEAHPSIEAAVQRVAKLIRVTNRPAGLVVWKGWHSWVVSGFRATADPALTDVYTVTGLYIEDVWYNRRSSLWSQSRGGYSRPPDSLVAVKDLPEDFRPFNQPKYADKNGKFIVVVPV